MRVEIIRSFTVDEAEPVSGLVSFRAGMVAEVSAEFGEMVAAKGLAAAVVSAASPAPVSWEDVTWAKLTAEHLELTGSFPRSRADAIAALEAAGRKPD